MVIVVEWWCKCIGGVTNRTRIVKEVMVGSATIAKLMMVCDKDDIYVGNIFFFVLTEV